MSTEPKFIQTNLFGSSIIPTIVPKKIRPVLSEDEKHRRREKEEAHIAWKLLKSNRFRELLTERQKFLLQKYYGIIL